MVVTMDKNITCFFTGHRSYPQKNSSGLVSVLDRSIAEAADMGYENFICGGAVGFDTLAACRVIVAAEAMPQIKLILALPCRDQTARWKKLYDISLYQRIKGLASEIIYVSDVYSEGCMHARNRMMADSSSRCIAYYNGSASGGTAYTVRYARESGLKLVNLYDELKKGI